jgi:hypothetical protein
VRLVAVPSSLDEQTFESLVSGLADAGEGRLLLDARRLRWVEPFGMLGLLAAGEVAGRTGERPVLQLPETGEVPSYLRRMGFIEQATPIFELHGVARRPPSEPAPTDVLLEITPVRSHADVHTVVDRVHERASSILHRQLGYPLAEAMQFSVILSEVCQNIIEHAQAVGWVAVQRYARTPHLPRPVVRIAVFDLGIGFRGSLASTHATRYGARWGDGAALEAAFIHGLTRFHDPGRGQGIQQIRRQVGRWGGKFSIRSGSARIADVPAWEEGAPMQEHLTPFAGAQISIVLPARAQEDTP